MPLRYSHSYDTHAFIFYNLFESHYNQYGYTTVSHKRFGINVTFQGDQTCVFFVIWWKLMMYTKVIYEK